MFISFPNTDMTQVVEILPYDKTSSIPYSQHHGRWCSHFIVHWNPWNKFHWNINRISNIFPSPPPPPPKKKKRKKKEKEKCIWKCPLQDVGPCDVNVRLSLRWRHNGRVGVSNHQPYDCLLNRLFRHRSKKASKLRVTGLCAGNLPVAGEFPAQKASNAKYVSIWWRHH